MIEMEGDSMPGTYEAVMRTVEALSRADQLQLFSELSAYLRRHVASEGRTSILELQGLGKAIWRDIDAQEYVDSERASWNG